MRAPISVGEGALELAEVAGGVGDVLMVEVREGDGVEFAGDVEVPEGVDELFEVAAWISPRGWSSRW